MSSILLVGCAPTQDDLPFVSFGSGGSIHGGRAMTIYANDFAVYQGFGDNPESAWRETEVLPKGVYARTRAVALAQIATLDLPDDQPICMDYGRDYIIVHDAPDAVTEIAVTCPSDAMRRAQIAVNNPRDEATGALIE